MKIKKVLLPIFALLVLASCNKEIETYEKKDVKVDSVFDNIEKKSEEEKPEESKEEEKKEEEANENKEENKQETEANNNNNNENNNQINNENNNNNQNQAAQTRQTTGLVNMRETPTANEDNYILSVPQGENVEFLEEVYQGEISWSKVRYQNTTGFIRSDLLDKK